MNLCNIRYIDMGFPSGTLWGDRNMGADIIEAYGKHFNRENVTPEQLSKFTHRTVYKNLRKSMTWVVFISCFDLPPLFSKSL